MNSKPFDVMELSPWRTAVGFGFTGSFFVALLLVIHIQNPSYGDAFLFLLSSIVPFYKMNLVWKESFYLIGFVFFTSSLAGFLIAVIYNLLHLK